MKIRPSGSLPKLLSVMTLTIGLSCASAIAAPPQSKSDAALKQQVAELQAKIKQLEAALPAHSPHPNASPTAPAMNMTSPTPMPNMSPGGEMKGMMNMMGMMKEMSAMPATSPAMSMTPSAMPPSALPGFPGVSHLYHIGSTGFFLDHAEHIRLSADQQTALKRIKEQALAAKNSSDRQIEQAEQDLAALTGADQPDLQKIEAKIRDIAKLNSDERISFIKAVGEAASLLTDDQRKILTGAMQPMAPSPSATMSPMPHM
jgi:Spy/CpxP family protein refolding chaperone